MSSLHSMKKEIAKRTLMFQPDMYNNTLGSVIICGFILTPNMPADLVGKINKQWNKVAKGKVKVDFWLNDPDFIDKALKLFDMEKPDEFPIAMVQSDFNVLFMPYVDGNLLPLREDGVYPQTARKGKIYPINWNATNNIEENGEVATKSEEENIGERKA